jgi:hypothetical protein
MNGNGGSTGVRRGLASRVTRRIRFPRSPPIKLCPGGEMVYTGDLKSPVERHAGSSPAPGTI